MKILVINAGSSSLKYQLIDMDTEQAIAKGGCEKIGIDGSFIKHNGTVINAELRNHSDALKLVLKCLTDEKIGVISSTKEIGAVGHRVLHGGEVFSSSAYVDDDFLAKVDALTPLGPLHMPANVGCIRQCMQIMPGVPMVGVFDTVFHATMPKKAYLYAIPLSDYNDYKIRKYGFHGTSHKFVTGEALKLVGKDAKVIVCHLGNGSSLSATIGGKCMDTSMGYTPLEGLVMGTRSGDIDPAAVIAIGKAHGFSYDELDTYLNKSSGLKGIAGRSDMRTLDEMIAAGDENAALAVAMFEYRVKKYIGAFAAALGGVDAICFTGGIGENSSTARAHILEGLEFMGVKLDADANKCRGTFAEISTKDSKVKLYVIPTNEELVIARDTLEIVSKM